MREVVGLKVAVLASLDSSTAPPAGYSPLATTSDPGTPPAKGELALPPSPTSDTKPDPPFPTPAASSRARLFRRVVFLALFLLVSTTLYLLLPADFSLRSFPSTSSPSCSARAYSSGRWVAKDPPLSEEEKADVLLASGFTGASQEWFKPHWFFGSKESNWHEMDDYRSRAAQWMWRSDEEVCREEVRRTDVEELVRSLVQRGGWMLLGDSLTEQHFFSLGCTLFPHVEVKWGAGWWEQLMFLRGDSPLVPSLDLPPSFNFTGTPLITNIRTDHGFAKDELLAIYESTPQSAVVPSSDLFTDYPVQSPPVREYLDRFFSTGAWERSEERYHALIFSTAAHFTPREFAFPAGQPEIKPFFEAVVANWTAEAAAYLDQDEGNRQVVVRAASSGHDKCKSSLQPFGDEWPEPQSYNWADIPRMNAAFETQYVPLAAPIRASNSDLSLPFPLFQHAADCLHMAVGTGVFEGWTDYLAYYFGGL
ncbi:hypothetical protein JCM8097_009466 [Rhodosporidiobolus ruineniae]